MLVRKNAIKKPHLINRAFVNKPEGSGFGST